MPNKFVLLLITTLSGFGCSSPTSFEDLEEPVVWWRHFSNLCSLMIVVDGNRTVWKDQGCERPFEFREIRSLTEIETQQLATGVEALPEAPAPSRADCSGNLHQFGVKRPGLELVRAVCGMAGKLGDVSGIADPHGALVQQFLRLLDR